MIKIEITHPKYAHKPVLKRITCPVCGRDVYLTMYTKVYCPCGEKPNLNLVMLAENLSEFQLRRISFYRSGE
jgi:hypothetical protein